MKLTKRDIEIIKFINDFGFCDMPRLGQWFHLKKTWMYSLLQRLVYAGLLNYSHILHGQPGVFYVTSKGAQFTDLPPIERIPQGQYDHQIFIINVYIKLHQLYPDAHWISERRLKREKFHDGVGKCGHIADGILLFPDGKQIAVEVELNVKGKNRIDKILKGYCSQLAIKEVWYFCTPPVVTLLTSLTEKMPFIKIFNLKEFLHAE